MEQISGSHRAGALGCSALRNDFQSIRTAPRPGQWTRGSFDTWMDASGGAGQGQELLGLGVGKYLGELSAAHGLMGQQILGGELQLGPAPGEDLLTAQRA